MSSNREVDEISDDDLMAASEMYDRLVKRDKAKRAIAYETRTIKDKWYGMIETGKENDLVFEVIEQFDSLEKAIAWRDRKE